MEERKGEGEEWRWRRGGVKGHEGGAGTELRLFKKIP